MVRKLLRNIVSISNEWVCEWIECIVNGRKWRSSGVVVVVVIFGRHFQLAVGRLLTAGWVSVGGELYNEPDYPPDNPTGYFIFGSLPVYDHWHTCISWHFDGRFASGTGDQSGNGNTVDTRSTCSASLVREVEPPGNTVRQNTRIIITFSEVMKCLISSHRVTRWCPVGANNVNLEFQINSSCCSTQTERSKREKRGDK